MAIKPLRPVRPIKPLKGRVGIEPVFGAGKEREPAIPKPVFPRIETNGEATFPILKPFIKPQQFRIGEIAPPPIERAPSIEPIPELPFQEAITPGTPIQKAKEPSVIKAEEFDVTGVTPPSRITSSISRTFASIETLANTNLPLAANFVNKVHSTLELAESRVLSLLAEMGRSIDPATSMALKELKKQGVDERNRILGMMNQRGLMRGGMLAQQMERFNQGILTAQERLISENLSKTQERLVNTLVQFGLQRTNVAQWEAEHMEQARRAGVSEMQWALARQDALQQWGESMDWDKEKWRAEFGESLRRFGIEQEKIDEALVWEKEKFRRGVEWEKEKFGRELGWDREKVALGIEWEREKFGKTFSLEERRLEWERGIAEKKLEFDYNSLAATIGIERARLDQALMLTLKQLNQENRQFDLSRDLDWKKFNATLGLNLRGLGLDQQKIDIAKREFEFNKARFREDVRQFDQGLKYKYAELGKVGERAVVTPEKPGKPEKNPGKLKRMFSYYTAKHPTRAAALGALVIDELAGFLDDVDIDALTDMIERFYAPAHKGTTPEEKARATVPPTRALTPRQQLSAATRALRMAREQLGRHRVGSEEHKRIQQEIERHQSKANTLRKFVRRPVIRRDRPPVIRRGR